MKRKIFISFIIASTFLLSLSAVSISKMMELSNLTTELYAHPLTVTNATKVISVELSYMRTYMEDVVHANNKTDLQTAVDALNKSEISVYKEFEIIFDRYLGDVNDIQKSYDSFVNWKPLRDEIISLAQNGKQAEAKEMMHRVCSENFNATKRHIDKMIAFAQTKANEFLYDSIETKNTAILITIIVTLFVLLVLTVITTTLIRNLAQTEKKIKQQNESIFQKEQQLFVQSRMAQMGEMISMIAHQWRQPLGAIASTSLNLNMKLEIEKFDLEKKEGRDACKKYFRDKLLKIDSLVQSLTCTIDDFRNFYKPNKHFDSLSVSAPIQSALNIIKSSLDTNKIELIENYNSEKKIEIYVNELMQVILNIVKNAQDNFIENSIENAKITINTEDKKDGVVIKICDNGGGISEDILAKIYDPYFSTKDEKNGTGLGLYMSKIIIQEHHNATILAENIYDGVCFTINLKEKIK